MRGSGPNGPSFRASGVTGSYDWGQRMDPNQLRGSSPVPDQRRFYNLGPLPERYEECNPAMQRAFLEWCAVQRGVGPVFLSDPNFRSALFGEWRKSLGGEDNPVPLEVWASRQIWEGDNKAPPLVSLGTDALVLKIKMLEREIERLQKMVQDRDTYISKLTKEALQRLLESKAKSLGEIFGEVRANIMDVDVAKISAGAFRASMSEDLGFQPDVVAMGPDGVTFEYRDAEVDSKGRPVPAPRLKKKPPLGPSKKPPVLPMAPQAAAVNGVRKLKEG